MEWLRRRPWVWVVVALAVVLAMNLVFVLIAMTHPV